MLNWRNNVLINRSRCLEYGCLDVPSIGRQQSFILLDEPLHLVFFLFGCSQGGLLIFSRGVRIGLMVLHLGESEAFRQPQVVVPLAIRLAGVACVPILLLADLR